YFSCMSFSRIGGGETQIRRVFRLAIRCLRILVKSAEKFAITSPCRSLNSYLVSFVPKQTTMKSYADRLDLRSPSAKYPSIFFNAFNASVPPLSKPMVRPDCELFTIVALGN